MKTFIGFALGMVATSLFMLGAMRDLRTTKPMRATLIFTPWAWFLLGAGLMVQDIARYLKKLGHADLEVILERVLGIPILVLLLASVALDAFNRLPRFLWTRREREGLDYRPPRGEPRWP